MIYNISKIEKKVCAHARLMCRKKKKEKRVNSLPQNPDF